MRQPSASSDPSKPDARPQPSASKRGFFASAGQRLKRVLAGTSATSDKPEPQPPPAQADSETDGSTQRSVHDKARELLQLDRGRGPKSEIESSPPDAQRVEPPVKSRATPPPLPSQRVAARGSEPLNTYDNPEAERPASNQTQGQKPATQTQTRTPKPAHDSKTAQLRARLGAAKAALAEAQSKRAAAHQPDPGDVTAGQAEAATPPADSTVTTQEALAPAPELLETATQPVDSSTPDAMLSATAAPTSRRIDSITANRATDGATAIDADSASADAEPIRTLTIARLLAVQGYFDRSLSIYDELLASSAGDAELRAEAEGVRSERRTAHRGHGDAK